MADTTIVSTANAAMVDYPLAIQAAGADAEIEYGAQEHMRHLLDAIFQSGGRVTFAGFRVSQRAEGANFSVDVSAGYYVVVGSTDPTNQGKYLLHMTSKVNVPTPSAPVSGTRVHRLVSQVRDKAVDGGINYDWVLWLREDTGSGTPAIPSNAGNLGTISIAAGQSNVQNSHITEDSSQAFMQHTPGGPTYLKTYTIDGTAIITSTPAIDTVFYAGYFLPVRVESGQRYRAKVRFRYEYESANSRIHFYLHLSDTQAGVAQSDRIGVEIPYHGDTATEYPVTFEAEFTASSTGNKYINLGCSVPVSATVRIFRGFSTDHDETYISMEPIGNNTTDRIFYGSGN